MESPAVHSQGTRLDVGRPGHACVRVDVCATRPSVDGFDSERFRKQWVATFGELWGELKFRILGYVLMPEHFHALIWPAAEANPSQIMPRIELHAQQSSETGAGQAPGRLAMVELEVLFLE